MNEKLIFFLGFVIEIRSCVTDFSFGRKKIWLFSKLKPKRNRKEEEEDDDDKIINNNNFE